MQRIGIAASKMAQGNLLKYNLFVVVISCLFSMLIFLVCGFTVLAALFLISLALRVFILSDSSGNWIHVVKMSMAALGAVIGALNILAILKNIKISKNRL